MKKSFFVLAIASATLLAQCATAPSYKPTDVETLQLQLKIKDLQFAQYSYNLAQQALQGQIDTIKKAHKWDDGVQYDPNKQVFYVVPKPVAEPLKK